MRYNQPYGQTDLNAPYVNGDPSIGRNGSIPPAEQMEYPQREIVNVILASGQVPDNADLLQLLKAIKFFGGTIKHGIDTGTANKIVVTLDPAPNDYTNLFCVVQKIATPNSGAMTIVCNDLPEIPLKDMTGANFATGALVGNGIFILWHDGAQMRVLGGSSSYTTISGLTASGGVATDVAVDGTVNHNIAKPSSNTSFNLSDLLIRRTSGGTTYKFTLGDLMDWIQGEIEFPPGEDPIYLEAGVYKAKKATTTLAGVARRATSTEVANRATDAGQPVAFVRPEDLPGDSSGVGIGAVVRAAGVWTADGVTIAQIFAQTITGDKFLTGTGIGLSSAISIGPCLHPSSIPSPSGSASCAWADTRRALFNSSQTWSVRNFRWWQSSSMLGTGTVDRYVEVEFVRTA